MFLTHAAFMSAILAATPLQRVRLTSWPTDRVQYSSGLTTDQYNARCLAWLKAEWPGIKFELPA